MPVGSALALLLAASPNQIARDIAEAVDDISAAGPVPAGNPGEWADSNDYPPSALREDIEGVVRFTLDVDAQGKVTACTVTQSSDSSALDAKTCELMVARAEFEPARDAQGRAVAGRWSSAVRWEIPSGSPTLPPAFASTTTYVVEPDGTVSDCKTEASDGTRPVSPCDVERFDISWLPDSKPVRRKVTVKYEVEHETID